MYLIDYFVLMIFLFLLAYWWNYGNFLNVEFLKYKSVNNKKGDHCDTTLRSLEKESPNSFFFILKRKFVLSKYKFSVFIHVLYI